MKYILEIPDNKAQFFMELIESMPFIKAKPMKEKAKNDTTEYLMSSATNHKRLLQALERSKRGETETHQLIEE